MLYGLFIVCLLLIVYPYAIYPFALALLNFAFIRRSPPEAGSPPPCTADLLIPAYNEEKFIKDKLRNLLTFRCNWTKVRVLVGTDGCTDRTAEIVRSFQAEHPGLPIQLFEFPVNRGKSTVLNELAARSVADVLILTDASTAFAPDTVERLLKPYANEAVAGVCGRKAIDPDDRTETGKNEGFYWKFEARLKEQEGKLYSVIGADGPVFSVRRACYVPLPPSVLIDDFYLCMMAVTRTRRMVYEREAMGYERSSESYGNEYIRRKRLATGAYQFLRMMFAERLFAQWNGRTLFCLFSHKIIRWTSPFYMIGLYLINLLLLFEGREVPFFAAFFLCQSLFYALALATRRHPLKRWGKLGSLLNSLTYLAVSNLLQIQGVYRGLFRTQNGRWQTVNRQIGENG